MCIRDRTEGLRVRFGKDYKRTSIGTFLSKMADKGFLTTYRVGRLAYVHALRDEEEYRDDLIRRETEFWFDGKLSKMVAAMGDLSLIHILDEINQWLIGNSLSNRN